MSDEKDKKQGLWIIWLLFWILLLLFSVAYNASVLVVQLNEILEVIK